MKYIISLFLLVLFTNHSYPNFECDESKNNKELWITIFVHGIISVKPYLTLSNMSKFMQDRIAHTDYERTIECIRKDPFFHQHHPMQDLGLHKIDMNAEEPGAAASAFANFFELIENYGNCDNRQHIFYTFGWSGLLSARMRFLEAQIFYQELVKLITYYHEQNIYPKLRVVGYSHGGNVTLNLGLAHLQENITQLSIDELILIGMPVVPETDFLINSNLFKKVYHFYSRGDRVQRIDLFSSHRLLSQRTFQERDNFKLPDKLVQIELRITRLVSSCCINRVARLTYHAQRQSWRRRNRFVRKVDPGHSELWSFGWTPGSYRTHFPLYPLPAGVFLGFWVNAINQYAGNCRNFIIDIRPFEERMIIANRNGCWFEYLPFLTQRELNELQQKAWLYKPENYSVKLYNVQINEIMRKVKLSKNNCCCP